MKRKHEILGKTFKDRFGNEFVVVETAGRDAYSVQKYRCRFLKSGYETIACCSHIIGSGHGRVQDRLSPSVHGVGIMGYAYGKDDPKIFDIWRAMIARCYNPKNPRYKNYGASGVTVCERWKRFDYFLEDVKELPGYEKEKIQDGSISLDKDLIDREKKLYSPETCCFIPKGENSREALKRRYAKVKCND